jgi:hypothetical protein
VTVTYSVQVDVDTEVETEVLVTVHVVVTFVVESTVVVVHIVSFAQVEPPYPPPGSEDCGIVMGVVGCPYPPPGVVGSPYPPPDVVAWPYLPSLSSGAFDGVSTSNELSLAFAYAF